MKSKADEEQKQLEGEQLERTPTASEIHASWLKSKQIEGEQLERGMRLRRAQWAVSEQIQECELSGSTFEAERIALHLAGLALETAIGLNLGELPEAALERLRNAKSVLDGIPNATKGEKAYPRAMALVEISGRMAKSSDVTPVLVCSCVHFCADQFRRGATWIDKSKGPIQFSDEQLASAREVIEKWKRPGKWRAVNCLLAHWNLDVSEAPSGANEHPLAVIWRAHSRRQRAK